MRASDWLMGRLADEGVRQVFLLPGGGAMHLDDALACSGRLEAVPCHHEQACGIAAEASGRVSEAGFGVALVTTGPGATNVVTPVAGAFIESLPLLVVSGQVKRADLLRGRPLRQSGVQEVDIVSLVAPVTKFARTVEEPSQIRAVLEEALYEMRRGRPGPVWIDVPLDVQAAPVDPSALPAFRPAAQPTVDGLGAELDRLERLLATAERPLLLAGHGVRISGGAEPFRRLAESRGIPVVTTWNALDLMPWDHPLVVGRPGVVALRAPNFAVQSCDLLIAIGCRMDNVVTAYDPRRFAPSARKVVVDVDRAELERHEMRVELAIASDARVFLERWLSRPAAEVPDWDPWKERCLRWKGDWGVGDGQPMSDTGQVSHYRFVDALSDAIPEGRLVVTGSSGLGVEVFYTVFRNRPGQRVFLTSGLGAMGYGLPAAIGACVGSGRRPTVCVEGDGSLQLNLQELSTLAALDLPLVLFVMNNGGYASIRNTQRNYFQGRFVGTGPEAGLLLPDTLKVCGAIGIPGTRIERAEELREGLAEALSHRGPFVCEVRLTPNETLAPKVAAIPAPDGSIVSMPLEDMSPLLPLEVLEREMGGRLDPRSVRARGGAG